MNDYGESTDEEIEGFFVLMMLKRFRFSARHKTFNIERALKPIRVL